MHNLIADALLVIGILGAFALILAIPTLLVKAVLSVIGVENDL